MRPIISPLRPGDHGVNIANLQEGLLLLLDKQVIQGSADDRRVLEEGLKREQREQVYQDATEKAVGIFQEQQHLHVTGAVDEPTARALNRLLTEHNALGDGTSAEQPAYEVKGTVRFADGFPARGVQVSAFDRDLRSEQLLGQYQTDGKGFYEIRYSARQFRKREKGSADLVVKAVAADGSLLAASPVLFNAPPSAELDVTIPAEVRQPPALFEKIGRALAPLLGDLKVEELEEDERHQDLSFLSGETGFEKNVLARFVMAHKLANLGIQAEFWFALLGGSFFQFAENQSLKEQVAAILDSLSSLDAAAVHKALIRSFNEKEIREALREKVAEWVEAFLEFIARQSVSGAAKPTFVTLALEHADIRNAEKQKRFVRLFNEYKELTPALLDVLARDESFKKEEIADLRTSFRLAELTQGDFSIVKMLKEEFNVRQPEQIRTLAKKSEGEWVSLVKEKRSIGAIKLPIQVGEVAGQERLPEAEIYGKTLERQFREAFPTAAFAGGLERAVSNGGAHGLRHAAALGRFLERHENFELLNTPVDDFLQNSIHPDFQALAKDQNFRLELKAVQRVFKLAPTFEATDALLADDLHSAQKIYRLGESEFVRHYTERPGFTADSARLAWNRAADTHAAVLTVVADLKALEAEALPLALKNNNEALSKTFPNWNNLFKAGDLCECEHCRSVLSPAAYFADLLMFLKDRETHTGSGKVKDVLFRRRLDLGFLELNCDNALTPFPYIDTVCEVLEDVVDATGENDLELTGFTAIPAGDVAAKVAVGKAFKDAFADPVNKNKEKIDLGDNFSLSQVNPADPNQWVVHGDNVTYLLKKKATPNFFAEVLRNTKARAAELRAYPQYVNPKAYDELRKAKYPLTLPFDLFAEEVRAAFQKCNLQRWDLMRTLRGATAPNNPTNGEIAAEYFGISADGAVAFDEKRLILVADATIAGQQKVWGEAGASWLNTVGNVKNFLRKTSLEYNELLALLDLKFINPTGDITVHHRDPSCDTDQKVIQVLDAPKLDRIHRFLRLWRKLKGWKMWELDLAIRHPRIGNKALDEPFLVNLFYFSQLRNRLGGKTTVEQICALLDDLNTETRFTKPHEKREDALYQSLFLNKRLINPLDPAFQPDPGTGDLPAGETITAHHPVMLAALGIREADLVLLKELTKASDGTPYITADLTLSNLSFLWRHAWLSKLLKFKAEEWKILLKIFQQDILHFSDPQAAWKFVEGIDHLKAAGFTPDELNWLLAADRSAKAAVKESDAARFLAALRKELQGIHAEYDPGKYDFLTVTPPTDVDGLTALLTSLLQKLNRDEVAMQTFIATLRDEVSLEKKVVGLPAGFDFPAVIKSAIRIRYDEPATTLRFTGVMTAAQRTTLLTNSSLAAVTGIAAYQEAIEEFFTNPRLALKFFEPVFTAPLANLPAAVDFKALPNAALALKISYDAEQHLLRFAGILSKDEKIALDNLSADPPYRNAVNSLFTQPEFGSSPPKAIWLQDTDLLFPLRDLDVPANDNLAKNLATATANALVYLSKTLSENAVVQQVSVQLGLTEALTRQLLTHFALMPPIPPDPPKTTLLTYVTRVFAVTTGVVDYATLKPTFDGWFWASRVAVIWKKWKVTLADLEKIIALTTGAQLLDFVTLPLDDTDPKAIASVDRFLRTSRLLRLRDSLAETEITLLEVLENLSAGTYVTVADFAADVQLLNESWLAADVEALTASLDLAYPADYLLAESWERLRRAFYFLDNLNAGTDTVKTFAATAMNDTHAKTLKELLRSKFGAETWLMLSAEIQDVLRERKRDALAAYLLTQPEPADAPSGKWENTNDLYAYYLLDIEMSSCQLTSRLVQGSGSVQLFGQRFFMGLEPQVKVNADGATGDSAWRWWKWMSKYRVWEANRKVFLWPENWIEPELKKDRSPFFKDLENALVQNEVNPFTVETAYANYLEKLDGVAQLEVAGFYQEDDGDNTIIHVFGRTRNTEPHLYYYRRYDYGRWTAWEKVELDIQGDYLIPAVINKRVFLFWPVFTEVPDEAGDSTANVPPPKTRKKLKMQMAVSDYRQGAWTPKRVSTDFDENLGSYDVEIIKSHYQFFAIDKTSTNGSFSLQDRGHSIDKSGSTTDKSNDLLAALSRGFDIAGCNGLPEVIQTAYSEDFVHAIRPERPSTGDDNVTSGSSGYDTVSSKWLERLNRSDAPQNDFTLVNQFPGVEVLRFAPVLMQTPDLFAMSAPWHMSYFDRCLLDGNFSVPANVRGTPRIIGTWLPFFYNDKKRTFFVLPSLGIPADRRIGQPGSRSFYPEMKRTFRLWEAYFESQVVAWLNTLNVSAWPPALRQAVAQSLSQKFPEVPAPPYTDEQLKTLMQRSSMRFFHYYLGVWSLGFFQFRQFQFKNFYHPLVCEFVKLVDNPLKGIPALMSRETQLQDTGFSFNRSYQPTVWVVEPGTEKSYPREMVDFAPDGAYSIYNWELFFHAPLLIANSLSKNQRFAEAREWYHFMFNPIGLESAKPGGSAMSKYWITKPFFETTDLQYVQQRIENLMNMLAGDTSVPGYSAQARKDLEDQVRDWRTNPFEPHRIANYRTVAYQKTVLMKYLDNLIAWGDYLFRQDSMESINEATQLYILAAEILGPSPKRIPPQAKPLLETFNELENSFDAFSNALVEVENLIPPLPGDNHDGGDSAPLPVLYFCIPHNEKMLGYWTTVADRLYKIRHCMNIEGVVRQLALFEPPIDPAALVKAVAGGMDISSALAGLSAPLPLYRFSVLMQKANEVCSDVRALGGALLAALEKKDAEAMGQLRQSQEIRLLEAVKAVREKQIAEAKENLEGIKKNKELVTIRRDYYQARQFMIAPEISSQQESQLAHELQGTVSFIEVLASILHALPSFSFPMGPGIPSVSHGFPNFGSASQAIARKITALASDHSYQSTLAATMGGYVRRADDWTHQGNLAQAELKQLDKQIAAAELRIAIAEKELDNHILQIENAKATDAFMRSKYTNQELYQWQVGQISGVYFQSYKLAYDLAKRAERCFRFELGLQDSSYIQFGYWDSLKKGLLSGEKLQYDLRRLETAYLEQNRREFELTKHISLALLDPLALVKLRETGRCFFRLPEEIFDLDYPGHYFRRIKSVSLTLPCVVGPYTTISCTLRLLKNSIRLNTANGDNGYPRNTDDQGLPADDGRFIENNIPVKAIAASNAQNDSGVFELSFRDERYLPFEGAGTVSEWSLELFSDLPANNPNPGNPDFGKPLRQFDYGSISDAILHVKYTAREDAGAFKNGAVTHLRDYFSQDGTTHSLRMFNLRQEFPTQWHRFLHPTNPANGNIFELEMSASLFSWRDVDKTLKVNTIWLLARCTSPGGNYDVVMTPPLPPLPPPPNPNKMTLTRVNQYGGLHFGVKGNDTPLGIEIVPIDPPVKWQLKMTRPGGGNLQEDPVKKVMEVEDVLLVLGYEWE